MKKLKKISLTLKILIALSSVALCVAWMVNGEVWHKPLSYLVTVLLPFVPDLLAKFFKWKLSDKLVIAYEVFLIFAMVLGIDLDLYKTFLVVEGGSYFDKIVHIGSGVLTAFVAKEILDANYDGKTSGAQTKKYNTLFSFLFIVAVTALVAVLWECFEFGYDQIAGGSMQQLVSEGVTDTMWDMIGALAGGAVAAMFLKQK